MNQLVYIGKNSITNFRELLYNKPLKRVFIVRSKKSYEFCGAKKILNEIFTYLECDFIEFSDFKENPRYEDLQKGLLLLRSFEADLIIAVGGGSVLDMAKLIRFFNSYSINSLDSLQYLKKKNIIPLYALPTTAGTGSEATHFAVLYKDNIKYSIAHDDILPDVAIVYPYFTYNNPSYLTSCTGFDAIAQAIEAYWNINSSDESDEYALRAIKLLYHHLPFLVKDQTNKEVRDKISEGSFWAGKAINITKTTAPHAFSYPFTIYYGIPHGHAVALSFIPFFIANVFCCKEDLNSRLSFDVYRKKMDNLLFLLNISREPFSAQLQLTEYVSNLFCKISLKLDKNLILNNINLSRLDNNPVIITDKITSYIIENFYIKAE